MLLGITSFIKINRNRLNNNKVVQFETNYLNLHYFPRKQR